jgi:RNA polymerase sigma-70 factor (ECF subfamily)
MYEMTIDLASFAPPRPEQEMLLRAIPGREISIVELWLDSPPDQPLHCPPAVTQVQFHRDGPTSRIVSYYAPRPVAST